MYTNKKRSENDQYNETSNHIQMKGGGGGGAGTPGDAGGPPGRRRTLSFVLIVFTSFFICIPFILCFQCVFDLYLLLFFIPSGRCEKERTSGKNVEKSNFQFSLV